jgi:hypothetical protein
MSKIALSGDASGTGTFTIASPNSNSNFTLTLPTSTGTMALLQTPSFATTIGVGGATPATTGAGITFPATQSASSDANTLDDYEEGTWTPAITGGSTAGTTTHVAQNGKYTKIGNMVVASGFVQISAMTGTGNLTVSLPFATHNAQPRSVGTLMSDDLNWPFAGSVVLFTAQNDSIAIFYTSQDNAGWSAIQTENAAWSMYFTVTYFV